MNLAMASARRKARDLVFFTPLHRRNHGPLHADADADLSPWAETALDPASDTTPLATLRPSDKHAICIPPDPGPLSPPPASALPAAAAAPSDPISARSLSQAPHLAFDPACDHTPSAASMPSSQTHKTGPDHNASATQSRPRRYCSQALRVLKRHWLFVGPGMLSATAYCDPGNWSANLSSGSATGYKLLFAILLSSLIGILLQTLCVRLGIVTGMDLAQASRRLILGDATGRIDTRRYSELTTRKERGFFIGRRALLWTLYAIAEISIVATELAELTGSAIAINLLFPRVPLWAGVLITTADVFLILLAYSPEKSTRLFEAFIGVMVLVTLICFCILVHQVHPAWGEVFFGFVPSHTLIEPHSLYLSISIVGATVMPHSLFLGSRFSTGNRLAKPIRPHQSGASERQSSTQYARASWAKRMLLNLQYQVSRLRPVPDPAGRTLWQRCKKNIGQLFRLMPSEQAADSTAPRPPLSVRLIKIHLPHATVDIIFSLVVMALTINALILIVAGAAFYYNSTGKGESARGKEVGSLQDAYNLLRAYLGKGSAIIFSIALLTSAEAASVTVTLAGQVVSEGFIRWKVHPFTRRMLTRLIAMIPSLVVCIAVGESGLNQLLLASQVILSVCLPFLMLPLIVITGLKRTMRVKSDAHESENYYATTITAVESRNHDTSRVGHGIQDKAAVDHQDDSKDGTNVEGTVPPQCSGISSTPDELLPTAYPAWSHMLSGSKLVPSPSDQAQILPILNNSVSRPPGQSVGCPSAVALEEKDTGGCTKSPKGIDGTSSPVERPREPKEEYVHFANNWFWNIFNTIVFLFLCVAILAALVQSF